MYSTLLSQGFVYFAQGLYYFVGYLWC